MTFQPVNYRLVHMYIPCFVASVTEFLRKRRWNFSAAPSRKTFTNPELLLSSYIYTEPYRIGYKISFKKKAGLLSCAFNSLWNNKDDILFKPLN